MAKADAKSDTKDDKGKDKGKPGSKKKKLIIMAVALLAAAGGGYYMLAPGGETTAEPEPVPGKVLLLDAITLNLADGHYLKLTLALQATADTEHELDGSQALDLAVSHFSNLPVAELVTNESREASKQELLHEISEAYHHMVMDIYLTEFVIQ